MALSFAQQRLWFLSQLEPDNPFYNSGHVVLMNGPLNIGALEKTLNEIVRRHESLRTIFREIDGQPVQIILPAQPSPLQVQDLSELPAEAREAEAKRINAEEVRRRFDLEQGPLFRVRLLRLSEEQHVVMFTTHHIISDNWSMNVLLDEVRTLYSAFSKNEPAMLPELPVQYADFAHWQQQWLRGETLEAELDYWRRQLDGAPPTLDLPTDKPRPPVQTFRSNTKTLVLSESLTQSLKQFCRKEGVTTFMALLAAFKVLLYRYSGQDDIVVGTPIAGRNHRELEGLIGFFLNTLVLRTKLSGALSFRELLGRVRDVTLGAFTHQELPFEKLVQELQPKRELSRTPLFQVLMVFRNAQQSQSKVEGLTLTQLPVEAGWSNFDMTLWASESFDKLSINLEYNADLFEHLTVNRMAEHFRQLLESVVAEPQQRLVDVPMLSEPERRQILIEWNDTRRDFSLATCFQELFEQQVEQHADRIAAVCEGQTLTYRELNTRANRIARRLVERGARAETIVALLGERSLHFLVVMVAIFKSGAAYLPLDPRAPEKRWRQIIEQSRASLVIADTEFIAPVTRALQNDAAHNPALLSSGELLDRHTGQEGEDENLPHRSAPDNLAYVIYTSGSTGVPKGAMIEHRGMLNHLYAKIQDLGLTADDVVAQTASQSFDISVWQFLAPLLAGGRIHIFDDRIAHDALQLLPQVDEQGITIWETVPSLLRAVLTEMSQANGNLSRLESLRWLIPTGEELPPELCRQWLEHYGHVPLVNAYGPTECSDDVSHHKVNLPPPATQTNLPIGRPVGNLQLYVVDDALQPVAIGVSGELCVGGVGVGRGYLNDAWRTAQVFIPDQLSGQSGARLYRTGDCARFLPSGEIEYLGRFDQQIKIRGYRVELGEIEALLNQHPSVKTAVVTAREEMVGGRRLVGYVVGQEAEVESGELRRYLKEKLPEYMVPSVFVNLAEIPLTTNGKIDRKALPAPDASPLAEAYLDPRNEIEETIAGILRETLELKRVGVHDDFFELGGHSLLATRVTSRLRERFQIDLSLRAIFERPTVAGLAAEITRLRSEHRGQLEAELLAELDQLSEEEAAALLENLSLTERGKVSA
jgi:amino acid adenylation domain-containing protein